jgi:hypothetical protein
MFKAREDSTPTTPRVRYPKLMIHTPSGAIAIVQSADGPAIIVLQRGVTPEGHTVQHYHYHQREWADYNGAVTLRNAPEE